MSAECTQARSILAAGAAPFLQLIFELISGLRRPLRVFLLAPNCAGGLSQLTLVRFVVGLFEVSHWSLIYNAYAYVSIF